LTQHLLQTGWPPGTLLLPAPLLLVAQVLASLTLMPS
jgi:hypothetical protein